MIMARASFGKGDVVVVLVEGEAHVGRVKRIDGASVSVGNPGIASEGVLLPSVPKGDVVVVDVSLVRPIPRSKS